MIRVFLFLLLFLIPMSHAVAGNAAAAQTTNHTNQSVENGVSAVMAAGQVMASNGAKAGMYLFSSLATIAIVLAGFKILFGLEEGRNRAIKDFLILLALITGTYYMMSDYTFLTAELEKGFRVAAQALLGGGQASAAVGSAISIFMEVVYRMWESIGNLWKGVNVSITGSGLDTFGIALFGSVFIIISMVLLFWAMAVYAMVYVLSELSLYIAVAIGPIFIPWLLISFTSQLFWGWLNFFLAAAAFKLIGPVVVSMASAFTQAVFSGSSGLIIDGQGKWNIGEGIYLFIISYVMVQFMGTIPEIASQIVGVRPAYPKESMSGWQSMVRGAFKKGGEAVKRGTGKMAGKQ